MPPKRPKPPDDGRVLIGGKLYDPKEVQRLCAEFIETGTDPLWFNDPTYNLRIKNASQENRLTVTRRSGGHTTWRIVD